MNMESVSEAVHPCIVPTVQGRKPSRRKIKSISPPGNVIPLLLVVFTPRFRRYYFVFQ